MSAVPVSLAAIPLGRVISGERVRVSFAFDVRIAPYLDDFDTATIWLDPDRRLPAGIVALREPSNGAEYGLMHLHTETHGLVALTLNATAIADLRDAAGGFFTVEGEYVADAGEPRSFTPAIHRLTLRSSEMQIELAA